jgi:Domain of unknown function (DUF4340)
MSTLNKVLIGVLVAQVLLALIVHTRTDAIETIRRPEPLLPGLAVGQIQRVAIFRARSPEDKNKTKDADENAPQAKNDANDAAKDAAADTPTLELRREGDSATWTLSSHWDFPARDGAAEELVSMLVALQTTGPVVTSDIRHDQLEVAANHYRRKVVIETEDGKTRVLLVGKPSRARQTFVRIDGQSQVHAVSDISEAGLDILPSAWIESSFLLLQSRDVAYMSVRNQNGFYEFQRNELGRWSLVQGGAPYPIPPGKKLNLPATDSWVKDMVRLTMVEPADPARQIDTPLATVTLRMKPDAEDDPAGADPAGAGAPAGAEPVEYVIEIGAKEADLFYVRMSGIPHAVMIRNPRLSTIIGMNDNVVLIPGEN